jgi:hypothetical protein
MSAAEVIELIKKLPPEERAQVRAFVNEGDGGSDAVKYIKKEEFEKLAPQIFADNRELLRRLAQ